MKAKDAKIAAGLYEALTELPKVRKQIATGRSKFYDGYALEIQSSEMSNGVGQGSDHYFSIPKEMAGPVLDAIEKVVREKLKKIGVEP